MANVTNGTVRVTVSGGVGPYQYTLLNAGNNNPVPQNAYPTFTNPVNGVASSSFTFGSAADITGNSGLAPGSYKVKIVDGNGCETISTVLTVINTPAPTATPIPDPTATPVPDPTATAIPDPTATAIPDPTATPVPDPTATAIPSPIFDCATAQLVVDDGVVGDGVSFENGGNATGLVPAQYVLGSNTYTATIIVPATDLNGNAFSNAGASIECTATAIGTAIPDPTATPVPDPTATVVPDPTATQVVIDPTATPEPEPTATAIPDPTATAIPDPTATPVPDPTATAIPDPTATAIPDPTATPVPDPTATAIPDPTATAIPDPTATPVPDPTATAIPDPTATAIPDPTATPVPDPTATAIPDPTATAIPDPTATPVPEANSYWFHGGTADDGGLAGYPYQQNLTNPASSYYLSDFTPVADYALVFDDMIATPSKYQPVYSGTLTDGFGWNYDEHADPNFYWLVVPTSAGLPDLTLTPHLSIDGAPDDIASEKLVFTSNADGLEYTLYKLNATEDTGGRALQINNI